MASSGSAGLPGPASAAGATSAVAATAAGSSGASAQPVGRGGSGGAAGLQGAAMTGSQAPSAAGATAGAAGAVAAAVSSSQEEAPWDHPTPYYDKLLYKEFVSLVQATGSVQLGALGQKITDRITPTRGGQPRKLAALIKSLWGGTKKYLERYPAVFEVEQETVRLRRPGSIPPHWSKTAAGRAAAAEAAATAAIAATAAAAASTQAASSSRAREASPPQAGQLRRHASTLARASDEDEDDDDDSGSDDSAPDAGARKAALLDSDNDSSRGDGDDKNAWQRRGFAVGGFDEPGSGDEQEDEDEDDYQDDDGDSSQSGDESSSEDGDSAGSFPPELAERRWFCTNCTSSNGPFMHQYAGMPDSEFETAPDGEERCAECGAPHYFRGLLSLIGSNADLDPEAIDKYLDGQGPVYPAIPRPKPTVTGISYDSRMLGHREIKSSSMDIPPSMSSPHPERPNRLRSIAHHLAATGLFARCHRVQCREATSDELMSVHSASHVQLVNNVCKTVAPGQGSLVDSDTYVSHESSLAARLSAGTVLELTQQVVRGTLNHAVALVRPPGHHAEESRAMGFCLFNNVAVAAQVARQKWGIQRVLILDWDVHHGNGTQHMFDEDPSVLYVSLHRYDGGGFYPGTGAATEVGRGPGEGASLNVPWPHGGMGDAEYIEAFQSVIMPVAQQFDPELVLISAGFDAADGDPLGGCAITPAGYAHMTAMLKTLANGRVVIALEGGYNLKSISVSMEACVRTLLGEDLPRLAGNIRLDASQALTAGRAAPCTLRAPCKGANAAIAEVIHIHTKYWPVLRARYAAMSRLIMAIQAQVRDAELRAAQRASFGFDTTVPVRVVPASGAPPGSWTQPGDGVIQVAESTASFVPELQQHFAFNAAAASVQASHGRDRDTPAVKRPTPISSADSDTQVSSDPKRARTASTDPFGSHKPRGAASGPVPGSSNSGSVASTPQSGSRMPNPAGSPPHAFTSTAAGAASAASNLAAGTAASLRIPQAASTAAHHHTHHTSAAPPSPIARRQAMKSPVIGGLPFGHDRR